MARAPGATVEHDHDHDHGHDHGDETRRIHTGHGVVALEVFENGVPPRWRLRTERGHAWAAGDVTVVTEHPRQSASRRSPSPTEASLL